MKKQDRIWNSNINADTEMRTFEELNEKSRNRFLNIARTNCKRNMILRKVEVSAVGGYFSAVRVFYAYENNMGAIIDGGWSYLILDNDKFNGYYHNKIYSHKF